MKSSRFTSFARLASIGIAAVLACSSASAVTAITATNTAGNQEFGGSLGFDFVVNSTIVVSQLGAFDDNGDGFNRDINVGIFARNENGTPLNFMDDTAIGAIMGQTTFSAGNPGTLSGSYRFQNIAPLTLTPGAYTLNAWGYGLNERNGNDGNLGNWPTTTDDGGGLITFVGTSRFGDAGTPGSFPNSADGGPATRYGAGNMVFDAIPEPSALALLIGCAGALVLRRRR